MCACNFSLGAEVVFFVFFYCGLCFTGVATAVK